MLRRFQYERKKRETGTSHSPVTQFTPRKSFLTVLRPLLRWKRAFKARSDFTPLYGENRPIEMRPQAYVETPQHQRIEWVDACGGPHKPLGKLPAGLRVGVIGGGPAGVTTAFEAVKAGAQVTLIEARHEVGGRARSVELGGKNVAEQGCMRFPPSAGALFVLAKAFGFAFIERFPNPGTVPTLVSYGGECHLWTDAETSLPGFENVKAGWDAFIEGGCQINGRSFESCAEVVVWLESPQVEVRMKAVSAWQAYITEFQHDTFLEGLEKIFGLTNTTPPAGKHWTKDDFNRFGKLGIGSGGFGAFYNVCFLTVLRYVPNSCETDLASFAGYVDGKLQVMGIRSLWQSIWESATKQGLKSLLSTKATHVTKRTASDGSTVFVVRTESPQGPSELEFDELFINLTVNVADRNLDLGRKGPDQLFPDATCEAIKNMHMTLSTKITFQVPRSPLFNDPAFPRTLITDGDLPQAYCFDYGDPKTVVVMLAYAWEEDSRRLESEKDPAKLFRRLKSLVEQAAAKSPYPQWAQVLQPVGDIVLTHWQEDPYALGAFAFAEPGQDRHCAALFYDFEKKQGPYLIGDSYSHGNPWVEGALESAYNCFSAVVKQRGTLYHPDKAPVNLIRSGMYFYD
ncbi:hypothetical protein EC957_001914 [Mortierella hygrophila]|uniref:Amine oxidase domain-containing protein n=1 Tax=Mortierella hygrophila TaxID=979708 RepID=A0A9P6F4V8_9FUNG|nr:hypothetical protein EC957_001914 [Mortierella hygrophila]